MPIRPRTPAIPPSLSVDIDQGLIHHYTSRLCSLLLSRHAHPDYQRLFLQSSILPKLQLMVEPLLACASLDLARQFPAYRPLALAYYAQAVSRTHRAIADKHVQGTEDWLLFNVLHLNLFETWNWGAASNAGKTTSPVLLHIQGAAQIFKLKLTLRQAVQPTIGDMAVARIAAEAFVYHTVNWALFHGNPIPATTMPAAELWDGLQPYLDLQPFPGAYDTETSPVLGVPWRLYRFLSDLTQLFYQRGGGGGGGGRGGKGHCDTSAVLSLRDQLLAWERQEMQHYEDGNREATEPLMQLCPPPPPPTSPYRQRTRLFVLALKLLVLKLLHPTVATTDARVQQLVHEATALIRARDSTTGSAVVLERTDFWPLLIVGSAIVDRDQVAAVRTTLQTMAETMHSVAFAKTKRALETIWAAGNSGGGGGIDGGSDNDSDGLTMLLGGRVVPGLVHAAR